MRRHIVRAVVTLAALPDVAHAADSVMALSVSSTAATRALGVPGPLTDAARLSATWGLPFAGVLMSIALLPLWAPSLWHHHLGKIAVFWAASFLLPFAAVFGVSAAGAALAHALIEEYLPFILLLAALYTVAGGICVRGKLHGSPGLNTGLLALGTALASLMGTTGAAMLLIRPLLRANDNRRHRVHVVVFFIFLVANAGGALSPLGDPPLFLGFLNGVSFFWATRHLALPTLFVCSVLLALFYALDRCYFQRREETRPPALDPTPDGCRIVLEGTLNFVWLGVIVALVLLSGVWKPGVDIALFGVHMPLQDLVRDMGLVAAAGLSLALTPKRARIGNQFDWAPIEEVAKLFVAIFVTMTPVIAILRAGEHGAFGGLLHLVSDARGAPLPPMYFWSTGLLSSFLDNAPTYLVFFNAAGGDAQALMTTGAHTLAAISAAAVFMGANTYIGNAPNFMVRSIARARGVRMPGFFGYMLWSGAILLPLFALMTWLFFAA